MSPEAWIGAAVGTAALIGIVFRLLWSIHKLLNVGEHLIDRVDRVEKTLNNGIKAKIDAAAERSERAERLAADAARAASVAGQKVDDGQQEVIRTVNALRGEVDIYTNVVLSDRQRIHAALRDLGFDVHDDPD